MPHPDYDKWKLASPPEPDDDDEELIYCDFCGRQFKKFQLNNHDICRTCEFTLSDDEF